jgi:two-component system, NarL family, response regulator NreC
MEPYRILLADDHVLIRQGVRKILSDMPGTQVVGEANDGVEAIALIKEFVPDLAILDIGLPQVSGIEVAREIRKVLPDIKILILTMHKNKEYLYHAIAAGAQGYLLKEDSDEELFAAIETIRNGAIYVTKALSEFISTGISSLLVGEERRTPSVLTMREREILKLIAEGNTNTKIAGTLHISIRTVETHRANIMNKLSVKNTAELVRYVFQNGLF